MRVLRSSETPNQKPSSKATRFPLKVRAGGGGFAPARLFDGLPTKRLRTRSMSVANDTSSDAAKPARAGFEAIASTLPSSSISNFESDHAARSSLYDQV